MADQLISSEEVLAAELRDPEFRAEWERTALARWLAVEIAHYRAEHGLSQRQLGERLGVHQSDVARMETGEHTPSLERLVRVAGGLDIELMIDIRPEKKKPQLPKRRALDAERGCDGSCTESHEDGLSHRGEAFDTFGPRMPPRGGLAQGVTMREQWSAVDEYVTGLLAPHDEALDAALSDSEAAGLPAIQVSPPQAKLLHLLARSIGARSILEVGTLGAYSTIWLGRALGEGGRLVTIEADPGYAEVARGNIARAGLEEVVELRVGAALDVLSRLDAEGAGPLDFTFIDADKENSPAYFAWALGHSRPGALIVVDNVVRDGTLAGAGSDDPKVQAQRQLHKEIATEDRVTATTIQTVGGKGYDGFTIALVR